MNTGILYVIYTIINIMREWSFKFLDRPVDNRKCGPAVVPAAIMGGSTILGGIMGLASADSQMSTNSAEAERNRQFNREEAEKIEIGKLINGNICLMSRITNGLINLMLKILSGMINRHFCRINGDLNRIIVIVKPINTG